MLVLIAIFALAHSGMASFRDAGEKLIGERAYRVLFAGISLPLALTTVVSFIHLNISKKYFFIFILKTILLLVELLKLRQKAPFYDLSVFTPMTTHLRCL